MKTFKLKDLIVEKISGEWGVEPSDDEGIHVIRTANFLNSGAIDYSRLVRRKIDPAKINKKRLITGDVLIAKSGGGPSQPVGRVVYFNSPDDHTYLCNNFTAALRPDLAKVFPRYLFLVLHDLHRVGQTLRFQNKTTGILNLKLYKYLETEVQLPSLDEQKRIAYLLSKVEGLITHRKQHLQQLDDLLKSVFLDMFGPNCAQFSEWPVVPIETLAAKQRRAMRTGPFGSNLLHSEFTEQGDVAVLGIDNAVRNQFAWGQRRFITNEKYKELENYRIYPNDVIVTIMGTIGRSAVVPDDIPLAINTKHLVAITVDRKRVNPTFLSYSIHSSPYILNQFATKNRGAIKSALNLSLIKETLTPLPPIELQDQFESVYQNIDELQRRYQSNISDLEHLFKGLSQKAFSGELDLSRVPMPDVEQANQDETETTEPMNDPVDDQPFKLPAPADVKKLESAHGRTTVLKDWLTAYTKHLGAESIAAESFLELVQQKLSELETNADLDWFSHEIGVVEYDQIKGWIFQNLENKQLKQQYENKKNQVRVSAGKD